MVVDAAALVGFSAEPRWLLRRLQKLWGVKAQGEYPQLLVLPPCEAQHTALLELKEWQVYFKTGIIIIHFL